MVFEKPEDNRTALYEIIANRLEQMILNDITQIDRRLPSEQVLSVSFGVSRPVIREALKLLKERGLISQKQGGRTVICAPNAQTLTQPIRRMVHLRNISAMQIFEIRFALETLSASGAAEKATEDDIAALKTRMQSVLNATDETAQAEADLAFHRCLAQIGGNPLLTAFIESIDELLREMIRISLQHPNALEDGAQYHQRLIEAIAVHDAQTAEQLMREHLLLSMRNYEAALPYEKGENANAE